MNYLTALMDFNCANDASDSALSLFQRFKDTSAIKPMADLDGLHPLTHARRQNPLVDDNTVWTEHRFPLEIPLISYTHK